MQLPGHRLEHAHPADRNLFAIPLDMEDHWERLKN